MKSVLSFLAFAIISFVVSGAAAVDPYYVYREIDLVGNAAPHCDLVNSGSDCYSTLNGMPARSRFGSATSVVRLPQFWDGTPITFGSYVVVHGDTNIPTCVFPDELPSRLSVGLSDPDTGQGVASVQIDFSAQISEIQLVTGTISDVQFLEPGKLYVIGISVMETEQIMNCEYWRAAGAFLKVSVILPFIFENGFEEGQAAFWSELYGY